MSKWISVKDKLPELTRPFDEFKASESVLCKDSMGNAAVCTMWDDGSFCDGYGEFRDIVKWMPIPEDDE